MIILIGDALARARIIASSLFGYAFQRGKTSDDSNASNSYLTSPMVVGPEPSSTDLEGHHMPLDHNFFQDTKSDLDFEFTDYGSSMSLSLFLPLGVMLLFAALILLVVMFRRHPAIVMAVAACSLLAAGAYNILLLFQSSEDNGGYHDSFDPRAPPKYE